MRLQHPLAPHPLGEMTFNPVARPGDADWRVMYLGAGDAQSGEQRDSRRLNPQRLDTLVGKILRIVPDLREHTKSSTVSGRGSDIEASLAARLAEQLGRGSGRRPVASGGQCPHPVEQLRVGLLL